MNDEPSLLAAVLAAPDDDLPRLVYADWLDEHGGEAAAAKAALIRVKRELEKLACPHDLEAACSSREMQAACRRCRLWPKEQLLVAAATMGDWAETMGWGVATYRRGFVGTIECAAGDWTTHADEVLARHPVTEVRLTNWPCLGEDAAGVFLVGEPDGTRRFYPRPPGESWSEPVEMYYLRCRWPRIKVWHASREVSFPTNVGEWPHANFRHLGLPDPWGGG